MKNQYRQKNQQNSGEESFRTEPPQANDNSEIKHSNEYFDTAQISVQMKVNRQNYQSAVKSNGTDVHTSQLDKIMEEVDENKRFRSNDPYDININVAKNKLKLPRPSDNNSIEKGSARSRQSSAKSQRKHTKNTFVEEKLSARINNSSFRGSELSARQYKSAPNYSSAKSQQAERGEWVHKSMILKKQTNKWERGDGLNGNLSYKKLQANMNLKHPRFLKNGESKRIPICVNTGRLTFSGKQLDGLDELGLANSIYFKLLKAVIFIFILCSILSIPLFFLYSSGEMSKQATGSLQSFLSEWTIGNLGESSQVCKQTNLRLYDTLKLWCPSGTKIQRLEKFGLQKVNATEKDNKCPQLVSNEEEDKKLDIDLDEQCSLNGLRAQFNQYYRTMMSQFDFNCLNKESCNLYVRNKDWPEPCREKIGLRLQVINIPVIKFYDNVTAVERHFESVQPDFEEKGNSKPVTNIKRCDPKVTKNCTTTVSTYIEYKKAYEYVISDNSTSFSLFSVVSCSNEELELLPPLKDVKLQRKTLGIVAVFLDLGYMMIFLVSLWLISYLIHLDSERHHKMLFETSEFAVQIKNLPKLDQDYQIEQLKAELHDHLSKVLIQETQQIRRLRSSEESRACEIIDIQFAMSDYKYLRDVVQIKKISNQIEKLELKMKECEMGPKLMKYQKRQTDFLAYIDELKEKYFENMKLMNENNQPVSAFVLFRSMEGVERSKVAFKSSRFTRFFFKLFPFCMSEKRKSKLFNGKELDVQQAVEPEILIWENFGVSKKSRFIRVILYVLFVFFMLILCIYIISSLETASNVAENELSGVQCGSDIDPQAANLDFYANQTKRTGDFHCFCKNLLSNNGTSYMESYLFPLDNEPHCIVWYNRYWFIIVTIGVIAVLIIFGNILIEGLVIYGSQFTRPVNQQMIMFDAIRSISWIQFINLGLVLLVINIRIQLGNNLKLPAGIFGGAYEDFSSMWYIDVGSQIMLSMVLELGAPHCIPIMQLMYYEIRRCWDRQCSCNMRKSKKLVQQDYEDLYIGPEFQLDARLAQIVAISWVTFMYSSGLPFLFLMAIVNFTIIYWVDKFLLLRFYRKPKNFDAQLIQFSVNEMKLSFFFHFIIGAFVYSNDRILSNSGQTNIISMDPNQQGNQSDVQSIFNLSRYNSLHVLIFIGGMFIMLLLIIFERTFFNLLLQACSCFSSIHKKFDTMIAISDDYYKVMGLKFLISEYERAKQEKQKYLIFMDNQKHTKEFSITSQVLNKYVKSLKEKEKAIQFRINELANKLGIVERSTLSKIHQLQINVEKVASLSNHKIKSIVQTYDIRDCEEYYGVLELESLLKKRKEDPLIITSYEEIRRESSKIFKPGSSLKKNQKIEEDDSILESDLDEILDDDDKSKQSEVIIDSLRDAQKTKAERSPGKNIFSNHNKTKGSVNDGQLAPYENEITRNGYGIGAQFENDVSFSEISKTSQRIQPRTINKKVPTQKLIQSNYGPQQPPRTTMQTPIVNKSINKALLNSIDVSSIDDFKKQSKVPELPDAYKDTIDFEPNKAINQTVIQASIETNEENIANRNYKKRNPPKTVEIKKDIQKKVKDEDIQMPQFPINEEQKHRPSLFYK